MWQHTWQLVIWICLCASAATATDVVYVTDLTIFTQLAPCAASAISYNVMSMTYSACPEGVTDLQSCVCTKDNNFASLQTQISSSVSYSCGGTATDDQASASSVYAAYCNQASITPFPSPSVSVSQYITDFPAWAELAPCAAAAVSYNVMSMTYDLCPEDPALLATCICEKNQNSLLVSQGINTSGRYSCSSHTADISSAQAVFSAYCGLQNGTSSFPTTSNPPGDMTYYITGMAEYASLAPCAQSGLSYGLFSQTYDLCPGGPMALASCVCIKDDMSRVLSSEITSEIKWYCSSTATEDISSAMSVYNYYCSAAKALVTPSGVTESITQTDPTAKTGTGGTGFGATATATSKSGSSSSGSNSATSSTSKVNVGAIAGAAAGVVFGLAMLAGLFFFFFWKRRNNANGNMASNQPFTQLPDTNGGKPELDGNAVVASHPVSPSTSTLKPSPPSRFDNVSPVSVHTNHTYPMPPELQGQYGTTQPPMPQQAELYGQNSYYPAQNQHPSQSELAGQNAYSPYSHHQPSPLVTEAPGQPVYEAPGQGRPPMYEVPGQSAQPQRAELNGMGWKSGPVSNTYEMDGGDWHEMTQQRPVR